MEWSHSNLQLATGATLMMITLMGFVCKRIKIATEVEFLFDTYAASEKYIYSKNEMESEKRIESKLF